VRVEFLGGPRDGEHVDLDGPTPTTSWMPPRTMHFASPLPPPLTSDSSPPIEFGMEPIPLHTYALDRGIVPGEFVYRYVGMESV
jgi:hypothetical protein